MKKHISTILLTFAIALCSSSDSAAAILPQDVTGDWAGTFQTTGPSGQMELKVSREGEQWKVQIKLTAGDKLISADAYNIKVENTNISFSAEIEKAEVKFTGKLSGNKLSGNLEVFQGAESSNTGAWALERRAKTNN